ncbi:hypothetical protein FBU30_006513 [Linnemannia zychae]|nr:hypothetical protein FBU30_006513 [Linnemannia zychae]
MTIFTNSNANLDVESIVYPQYDTRGDFNAIRKFVEWTQEQVKSREEFNKKVYSKLKESGEYDGKIPPVYVCFLGHSMGGLVAADAALILSKLPQKSPIIGILAFDTPYYGLNNTIFTQAAYERVAGYAQKASGIYALATAAYLPAAAAWSSLSGSTTGAAGAAGATTTGYDTNERTRSVPATGISSSKASSLSSVMSSATVKTEQKPASKNSGGWSWGSIALGVGAAVAATGAAVVVNKHMNTGMEYVNSHIQVDAILHLPIGFHCFYTRVRIPASSTNNWQSCSRTFIELSSITNAISPFFSPRDCSGQDEIEAHMEMFNPAKNYDYYPMGEETVRRVRTMVDEALKLDSN